MHENTGRKFNRLILLMQAIDIYLNTGDKSLLTNLYAKE